MKTFLEQVVDELMSNGIPLDKQALVLPSRRAITFFHRALAQRMEVPVMPPVCLTLEDLLKKELGIALVDPLTARLVLYQVYQEITPNPEPFELFDSWSSAILKDFNTVDTYLIDAKNLYRDLKSLKEINEWSYLEDELGDEQISFNSFWVKLGELYEKYHQTLLARGLSTSGKALRELAQSKKKLLVDFKRINYAGFNALSPAESALLDNIYEEDRLAIYWDAAEFYVADTDNPAGMFIRRWKRKPWPQKTLGSWDSELQIKVRYSAHPHAIGQCRHAGQVLKEYTGTKEQTALVLADETLLQAMLESLPAGLEAINVTMGMGIQGHVMHQFVEQYVLLLLNAQRNKQVYGTWQIHGKGFLRWAETAVDAGLIEASVLRKMEFQIIQKRWVFLGFSELESMLPEKVVNYLTELNEDVDLIKRLLEMLNSLETSEGVDLGVRDGIRDILLSLTDIISEFPFVHDIQQLWKCLRTSLNQEKVSFLGEPLEGVQLMGLLETRALDFKQVILIGANEGTLPKSKKFDTFLPSDIRRHYQLPTQTEEDAVFAYYFYRLIQHPKEAVITYCSEKDETGGGEMSRYLRQLIMGAPQRIGWRAEMYEEFIPTATLKVQRPELIVQRTPELTMAIEEFFKKGVSVSRLNDYLRCPLDFYFKKLLGLQEKEELEEEVGSNELGDIVHQVLENLYGPHVGKGSLSPEHVAALKQAAKAELVKVIKEKGLEQIMLSGESALVAAMALRMLFNFFDRENYRAKAGHLEVKALEHDVETLVEISPEGKVITVKCTAKIDREEISEGSLMIIDYKTGIVDGSKLKFKELTAEEIFHPDKSKALQLLYYTWIYWKSLKVVAQAGIISMVGAEVRPQVLEIEQRELLESDLKVFEELLKEKLSELYLLERFTHNEEQGYYCEYCPVKAEKAY